MLEKLFKNNIFLTIVVSVIVFGIINILIGVFSGLDRELSDKYYQDKVGDKLSLNSDVVLIGIDEKTLKELGRFPFNRNEYTKLLKKLQAANALVIGFDIMFPDDSDAQVDEDFSKMVKQSNNVFLGGGQIIENGRNNEKVRMLEKPFEKLLNAGRGLGYFTAVVNETNKKVYSIHANKTFTEGKEEKIYPHFSIGLLQEYYSKIYDEDYKGFNRSDENFLYITPDKKIPLHNSITNEVLINYVKADLMKSYSFVDVLNNSDKSNTQLFEDKLVLIGAVAGGMNDVFNTPNGEQAGVFTHANMINTVLTNQYKLYFNKNLELLLIFFVILFSVYLNLSSSGRVLVITNAIIIGFISLLFVIVVNAMHFSLNYPSQFIFALVITLTVSNILKSFMEDKNKSKLNKALGQYVSKDIAEEILHGTGKVNLDGERKDISIFFSDIEGFTTISEKMNPEELVQFLREYLGSMSNIIMDQRGLIDKYEGDAIMALWGVFGHEESSTFDNCNSALDQQEKLAILNVGWKEKFGEELKIRMGLHTGEAIVGNIGATGRKMEFTALGDSVNLASRLEEVNKKYGTYLCTSEVVYKEQRENFEFRYLDKIRVKGKTIPVGIYELLSKKGECSDLKNDIVEKFMKAIDLYLNREFEPAKVIFEELSLVGDSPSNTYITRCDIYIKDRPDESWDGVWTMNSK